MNGCAPRSRRLSSVAQTTVDRLAMPRLPTPTATRLPRRMRPATRESRHCRRTSPATSAITGCGAVWRSGATCGMFTTENLRICKPLSASRIRAFYRNTHELPSPRQTGDHVNGWALTPFRVDAGQVMAYYPPASNRVGAASRAALVLVRLGSPDLQVGAASRAALAVRLGSPDLPHSVTVSQTGNSWPGGSGS